MGEKARELSLNVVLDTHALVKFFKDEAGAENIQIILNNIEKGKIKGLISTITSAEILYILARYKDIEFAKAILKYIKLSKLRLIEVSEEIAELGGEFKFKYAVGGGLPLADALIATTAVLNKAVLISDEPHFKKIKEVSLKNSKAEQNLS